jgi:hypothetical protein
MRRLVLLPALLVPLSMAVADEPRGGAELVEARKIWDKAPHNAFTDLIRFDDRWFCVFREGKAHVSPDGALRVITSVDGNEWTSAALITSDTADLRDAKIALTPDRRLMLCGAGALHPPAKAKHQSFAWFSANGREWGGSVPIGEPDLWLWRVTWQKGAAYGVGYGTADRRFARLYKSGDGVKFETLVDNLYDEGYPNESTLTFLPDGAGLCLLRRDGGTSTGLLGRAAPPYTEWTWKDLGTRIGGPNLIRLADGRLVAAVRLYDGKVRTSLAWLDADQGTLTEFLALPSGGDTSYPGLVFHDGLLWVSYYSSHEGKTSIYLAKVRLPEGVGGQR